MPKRISEEFAKEVKQFVASLSQHNFYDILGVSPEASREEIKRTYFRLAKIYHPDVYYGQDLGDLKADLNTIFRSITSAHDLLTDES